MSIQKLLRLIIALLFGLTLALVSTPAYSQDDSFIDQCYEVISEIENYYDLDEYGYEELYCLFVVELDDAGYIDASAEYSTSELQSYVWNSLQDIGDYADGSNVDDYLTYEEIYAEYQDTLPGLISQGVNEADEYSSLFQQFSGRLSLAQLISTQHHMPLIKGNSRGRGGTAINHVSSNLASAANSNGF